MMGHLLIVLCIALMVYGQLVLRWQMQPADHPRRPWVRTSWIASGVAATMLRAVLWLLVLSRFEVSYAYPLMSLAFALVVIFGIWLLGESVSRTKLTGAALIVAGVLLVGLSHGG